MTTTRCFSYLALFLALSATVTAHISHCAYTILVKTGDRAKAGTDSKIKLTVGNFYGKSYHIPDLEKWGIMGKDYDYYERGNLDLFSGRETCIKHPVCRLKLESDAKGESPGWFVEFVEVATVQPEKSCRQVRFPINKWLGVEGNKELNVVLEECKDYVA